MAAIDSTEGANLRRRRRGRPQVRPDDETRQLIYEAARHEFASRGYAATSIRTVARRAGVSTKTLYRLIPNKAALFERMVSDRVDRFLSDVNLQAVDHADIDEALYEAPLGADIARSNPKARRAFAKKLERMIDIVAEYLPNDSPQQARQIATGTIATILGTLALSRAVGSRKLSNDILAAGRKAVVWQAAARKPDRTATNVTTRRQR
jgi:AcrR family transcriptional regulator